jgi:hypothetical protein
VSACYNYLSSSITTYVVSFERNHLVGIIPINRQKEKHSMIDAADTGDGTWGHLADTEHFGRVSRKCIIVPRADLDLPKYRGSTRAVHCMIYSRSEERIFGIYSSRAIILVSVRHLYTVWYILIKTIYAIHLHYGRRFRIQVLQQSKVYNPTNPATRIFRRMKGRLLLLV